MKKYYYGIGLLFMALLLFSSCEKEFGKKIPYVDEGNNTRKHIASLYHVPVYDGQEESIDTRYVFHWDKDLLRTVEIKGYTNVYRFGYSGTIEFEYNNTGKVISARYITKDVTVYTLDFNFVYTNTLLTEIYCRDSLTHNANQFLLWKLYYNDDGLLSKIESYTPSENYTLYLPSDASDVLSTTSFTWENGNIIQIDESMEDVIDDYGIRSGYSGTSEFEYDNKNSNKENLMPFFLCIFYIQSNLSPVFFNVNYLFLDYRHNMLASLLSKKQIINSRMRMDYYSTYNESNSPYNETYYYVDSAPREITYDGEYMVYYSISNGSGGRKEHELSRVDGLFYDYFDPWYFSYHSAIYYTDGSGYWWGPDRF